MSSIWQTVRVFISSTFRDMQAERDHLVRFVFPELRQELLHRQIHLVDVDLRWGVTSEQDALSVCREVVDECRPRFLCILGGRYGWVPPGKTRSITADEVHYGILDLDITNRGFAYFYFRDPSSIAAMVEAAPGEFREATGSHGAGALAELKTAITDAGLKPFIYRAQWDDQSRRLIGLKEFGDRVYTDLKQSIDQEFGPTKGEKPDEFTDENAAMEAFIEERIQRFVLGSRQPVWNELRHHAECTGGNGYMCLTGEAGSGKSALLGKFCQNYREAHPQDLVIPHFVGASPGSTDVRRTLRRLCHELVTGAGLTADIPEDPEKLRVAFAEILQQASAKERVVILLDAINQFDPTTRLGGWSWLPEELPATARVILSALSGPALESLRQRHQPPRPVELQPLDASDREAIIREFLHRYRKSMSDNQRKALLAKADAGTPLYLLVALEELRTLGTYEEITDRIAQLPPDTRALFIWILKRLENDDGFRDASGRKIGGELVSRFVSLLGASRHGLSQQELVELLSPGDPQGNLAALVQLLRPYLMLRGELLDFYHGQFRQAAATAYLSSESQRLASHTNLASYFHAQGYWCESVENQCQRAMGLPPTPRPANVRKVDELPWQRLQARQWDEVEELFTSLSFLESKSEASMIFELADDFSSAVHAIPIDRALHRILLFLQEALLRDIHFIARHPTTLFQCFWNSCWWFDCTEAAQHYEIGKGPGHKEGHELSGLLERWRMQKAQSTPGICWLCSHRPPVIHLGTPQLAVLRGHEDVVKSVAFSPDGLRVISGSNDNTTRLWDPQSGRQIAVLRGHDNPVLSVAFSPNGRHIVSGGSWDKSVRVWEAQSGAPLTVLHGHEDHVNSVVFSPDGQRILSGSKDKTVRLWDALTGVLIDTLRGHEAEVTSVAFSPDGRCILSGSNDETVRLWDALTGVPITVLKGEPTLNTEFRLASNTMLLVDTKSVPWANSGFKPWVNSVTISPDGRRIGSGLLDGNIRLWDAQTGVLLMVLKGHDWGVNSVVFSPDGRRIVSGSSDETVRIWDAQSGAALAVFRGDQDGVYSVAFSPDGRRILTGSMDRTLRLWDAHNLVPPGQLRDHEAEIASLAVSPDGRLVVSGSSDKTVRVWDAQAGACLAVLRDHQDAVNSVAFSPDGRLILSGSGENMRGARELGDKSVKGAGDYTVRIWDAQSGALLEEFRGHENDVTCVAYSPDGQRILSASWDHTIRLWDADSGATLVVLRGHGWKVSAAAFSRDGSHIVSSSIDKTVRLWDAANGAELGMVIAGFGVDAVAFSLDGRRILIGNCGKAAKVRIWEPETGTCEQVFDGGSDVAAIAAGPDAFPWRAVSRNHETVIEPSGGGPPAAWFPLALEHIITHPDGRLWAGVIKNHLFLLRLERAKSFRAQITKKAPFSVTSDEMYEEQLRTKFDRCLRELGEYHVQTQGVIKALAAHFEKVGKPNEIRRLDDERKRRRMPAMLPALRKSAEGSFTKGNWEAAETGFQELLKLGDPLSEIGPRIVTCLLNAHEDLLPADAVKIESLLDQLEAAGHAVLTSPLRQQFNAKRDVNKRPWWRVW